MNTQNLLFIFALAALVPVLAFAIMIVMALPQRIRMEHRASDLHAQHPHAERTSVYLPLHSAWAWTKQKEIDTKIEEMGLDGWTFLRASEINPLRTIRSWGGGLTLHFIRTNNSETRNTA